jgi:hypothetical protein
MRRESHVRFCEGVGVRSPRATRRLTVDPMLGKRSSVLAVISHKTREIIQLAITELPQGKRPAATDDFQRNHSRQSPSDP